jgi:ribonucleoside-diphosphate reductase alpha chain
MDYLFRWLASKFQRDESAEGTADVRSTGASYASAPAASPEPAIEVVSSEGAKGNGHNGKNGNGSSEMYKFLVRSDAPTCPECGSITVPNGSCHKCINCGTTTGCS